MHSEIDPFKGVGEEPEIVSGAGRGGEIGQIESIIARFFESSFNSFGIICKTPAPANRSQASLADNLEIKLLNALYTAFGSRVVVTTAYPAKGLEFDQVIAPFCSGKNYHTETDRQLLHVACTAAMNRLTLAYSGTLTQLAH